MTQQDFLKLLSPLFDIAFSAFVTWAVAEVTGLLGRFKANLEANHQTALADMVAQASTLIQAGMENEAGLIRKSIQDGSVSLGDTSTIKAMAVDAENRLRQKYADSWAKVSPLPGAIAQGIEGKIVKALVPAQIPTAAPQSAPQAPQTIVVQQSPQAPDLTNASFQARVAIIKPRLMNDLNLKDFQAAGLLGNLGYESKGLTAGIQEVAPVSGKGGLGWGQWTGVRRTNFENYCTQHSLQVTDPEANYQFLVYELLNDEKAALAALQATTTLEEATTVVEQKYERAGVVAMDRRQSYAQIAQNA